MKTTKKADLVKRIEELERQVRELQSRPPITYILPYSPPTSPYVTPYVYPQIWCGTDEIIAASRK